MCIKNILCNDILNMLIEFIFNIVDYDHEFC